MTRAVDVSSLPGAPRRTIPKVERDYLRYRGIIEEEAGQLTEAPGDMVDDLD